MYGDKPISGLLSGMQRKPQKNIGWENKETEKWKEMISGQCLLKKNLSSRN